jgi:hypothetical protein
MRSRGIFRDFSLADMMFGSPRSKSSGRAGGFKILELNGAAFEATSAYDASKSLCEADGILFEQWELVFAIGAENRRRGYSPDRLANLLAEWKRYQQRSLCHPLAE